MLQHRLSQCERPSFTSAFSARQWKDKMGGLGYKEAWTSDAAGNRPVPEKIIHSPGANVNSDPAPGDM